MRISYNAPVILTFTFVAAGIRLLCDWMPGLLNLFIAPPVFDVPWIYYPAFIIHILGHSNWEHYFGNFSLMLLIGPILEEKYGSKQMFYMIVLTALLGGLLNTIFFDTGLIGASGVVFMMIVLASFVNVQRGTLPLTFLLVLVLYIGQEVIQAFSNDNISQFAHIMGGGAGAFFGFMVPPKGTKESTASSSFL